MGWRTIASCVDRTWFLLALSVASTACGERSAAPAPAESRAPDPAPIVASDAQAVAIADPADTSLSLDEYIEAGVPSLDVQWTGAVLRQARIALQRLVKAKPGALPRRGSRQSGALFARLVTCEYVAGLATEREPLADRAHWALDYVDELADVRALYDAAYRSGMVRDDDVVEARGAFLRCAAAATPLIREAEPKLTVSDEGEAFTLSLIEKIDAAIASALHVGVEALGDVRAFGAPERILFAGHLAAAMPALVPRLEPAKRASIEDALHLLQKRRDLADVAPALAPLVEVMRTAPVRTTP